MIERTSWSIVMAQHASHPMWRSWPVEAPVYQPWKVDFFAIAQARGETLAQVIRSAAPWAFQDLSDAQLEAGFKAMYPEGRAPKTVSYWDAAAAEYGAVDSFSQDDSATKTPQRAEPTITRDVSGVGAVEFPSAMPIEEIDRRAQDLAALHFKNEGVRSRSSEARKKAAARRAGLLWLAPIAAVFAIGWSFRWTREGFRRGSRMPHESD